MLGAQPKYESPNTSFVHPIVMISGPTKQTHIAYWYWDPRNGSEEKQFGSYVEYDIATSFPCTKPFDLCKSSWEVIICMRCKVRENRTMLLHSIIQLHGCIPFYIQPTTWASTILHLWEET